MAGEIPTSVGRPREIQLRSDDRTYYTSDTTATLPDKLLNKIRIIDFFGEHNKSRRTVFRARCTPEVIDAVAEEGKIPSVSIPLAELGMNNDVIATFDHNIHPSDVPEWDTVYDYWQTEKNYKTPLQQINEIPDGYSLTRSLIPDDAASLAELWKPFGWTEEKVANFIGSYKQNQDLWISGVRNASGKLVSACMGEAILFDGIYMVEATEFGTLESERRKNLSTLSVIGLNAQVVERAFHQGSDGARPLIISEYNMDPISRSDIVGRKAGMTIPGVEGVADLTSPKQVLRKNVAVLDGGAQNDLDLNALSEQTGKEYDSTYKYLRNFIVGMMTAANMDKYYSPEQVQQILSKIY